MRWRLRRGGRVALVPNQWSGSVQQYYHFLLGYLAPILIWLEKSGAREVTVRDCGPMNRWFECTLVREDVEIMQVGHFLHVFAGRLQPAIVLRGMDFPDEFNSKDINRFRSVVTDRLGINNQFPSRISVIDRTTTDPFYATKESEIDLAGAARRSTPGLQRWATEHVHIPSFKVFDATDLDVRSQLEVFTNSKVLIGQHGAGLTNMVFMEPGGTVIEIHPPLPTEVIGVFENLARACGHSYVRISQDDVHGSFDTESLNRTLRRLI